MADQYRILSLDGGGAWALIQVQALMKMYGDEARGREVLRSFDLAAANSGGSLVLGGLLCDLKLKTIEDIFLNQTHREKIFSQTKNLMKQFTHRALGIGPKYRAHDKDKVIASVLNAAATAQQNANAGGVACADIPLGEIVKTVPGYHGTPLQLIIVGFDYDRNRAKFFKSEKDHGVTLARALHASTNAPINYFDAPAQFKEQGGHTYRYWDGAITGNNNPVLCATTQAVALGQKREDIVALTLGTSTTHLPWLEKDETPPVSDELVDQKKVLELFSYIKPRWLLPDIQKMAKSILAQPVDTANYTAHMMTCPPAALKDPKKCHIVRMNPMLSPILTGADKHWTLPHNMTFDDFLYLKNLDMDAVKQEEVEAIVHYTALWLNGDVRNEPIRMNGDTLETEIGDATFADADKHWHALTDNLPHGMGGDTAHRHAAQ